MKKEKAAAAKAAFDKIVQQTEMVRSADDEIARLRDLLWEEELLKKSRILEEEREAKRLANIAEMKRQNDIVLANKRKQQAVEQAEEERLVQVMIDKFKRDDEEERQKQQAIRDAKEHYKGMISDDADAKHERYLKHLADEENLKQDDDRASSTGCRWFARRVETAWRSTPTLYGASCPRAPFLRRSGTSSPSEYLRKRFTRVAVDGGGGGAWPSHARRTRIKSEGGARAIELAREPCTYGRMPPSFARATGRFVRG